MSDLRNIIFAYFSSLEYLGATQSVNLQYPMIIDLKIINNSFSDIPPLQSRSNRT